MFKLPDPPSTQAGIHELADYAEILAVKKSSASIQDILGYMVVAGENDMDVGCEGDDVVNAERLDAVMIEIDRRLRACNGRYPYRLDKTGTVLYPMEGCDDVNREVYDYLLLSTRLNMTTNKVQKGIDGTAILEELAAVVLKNYLGGVRAESVVFGTAYQGTFEEKINDLHKRTGEGSRFRNIDGDVTPDAKDDKLDVVFWLPFIDRSQSQIFVFGQCKTGTNWKNTLSQLNPYAFISRWMDTQYIDTPTRAFCISEAADRSKWKGMCLYSGIMFDRCRLMDFLGDVPSVLMKKIKTWNKSAWASVPKTI